MLRTCGQQVTIKLNVVCVIWLFSEAGAFKVSRCETFCGCTFRCMVPYSGLF